MPFVTVSEAAHRLDLRPRVISDAYCARELDDSLCPIIGRVRLIPEGYLRTIARLLCGGQESGDMNMPIRSRSSETSSLTGTK